MNKTISFKTLIISIVLTAVTVAILFSIAIIFVPKTNSEKAQIFDL